MPATLMSTLAELYTDFLDVLSKQPAGDEVLNEKILPVADAAAENGGPQGSEESILTKYNAGSYNTAQPMSLYADLKFVVSQKLSMHPVGSPGYQKLRGFFRAAVDLLLRDARRLGLLAFQEPANIGDQYMRQLQQSFECVYADAKEWYGEAYYLIAQNGPLFTTETGKATIDPRESKVGGSVHTVKLLPHLAPLPEVTLGYASPSSQVPYPFVPPTDILGQFTHPARAPLGAPRWLNTDPYASFAPRIDTIGSSITPHEAIGVWEAGRPASSPESPKPEAKPEPSDIPLVQNDAEPQQQQQNYIIESSDVDVEALLEWTPYSFIDQDEIDAAKNGTERELAAHLLLELQYLQRERLAAPGELDISDEERHVALKAHNVLGRLVSDASPDDIDSSLSKNMPVLMRNYQGTLPTADFKTTAPQVGPQRLAGLSTKPNGKR